MGKDTIFTRNQAANIVDLFEDLLEQNGITLPSPEDDEKEPDNDARIYGSVYYGLVDGIEAILVDIAERAKANADIVSNVFSGE